jgi:ribosomal protein L15
LTRKTKYVGKESGKSSSKWWGGRGNPKGYGASAGDGKTSDTSLLGKIVPVFKKGGKDK